MGRRRAAPAAAMLILATHSPLIARANGKRAERSPAIPSSTGNSPGAGVWRWRAAARFSDYKGYNLLPEDDILPVKALIADKGYDSDTIRDYFEKHAGVSIIVGRKCRKDPIAVDEFLYGLHDRIERRFNWLKNARRLARTRNVVFRLHDFAF